MGWGWVAAWRVTGLTRWWYLAGGWHLRIGLRVASWWRSLVRLTGGWVDWDHAERLTSGRVDSAWWWLLRVAWLLLWIVSAWWWSAVVGA